MSEQTQQRDSISLNRRQRRQMLRERGLLRYISKMTFTNPTKSSIRQQNMEQGRKIHEARWDAIEQAESERLEAALTIAKERWSVSGYNDAEIVKLEEAWALSTVKNKESYREDKKRAKQLRNEVEASFVERNK